MTKSYAIVLSLITFNAVLLDIPGTHINATLLDGCLKIAKKHKIDCCAVLLDVFKAFASIEYTHIVKILESFPIPQKLHSLIITLTTGNHF